MSNKFETGVRLEKQVSFYTDTIACRKLAKSLVETIILEVKSDIINKAISERHCKDTVLQRKFSRQASQSKILCLSESHKLHDHIFHALISKTQEPFNKINNFSDSPQHIDSIQSTANLQIQHHSLFQEIVHSHIEIEPILHKLVITENQHIQPVNPPSQVPQLTLPTSENDDDDLFAIIDDELAEPDLEISQDLYVTLSPPAQTVKSTKASPVVAKLASQAANEVTSGSASEPTSLSADNDATSAGAVDSVISPLTEHVFTRTHSTISAFAVSPLRSSYPQQVDLATICFIVD
jgi:hypothetical protein